MSFVLKLGGGGRALKATASLATSRATSAREMWFSSARLLHFLETSAIEKLQAPDFFPRLSYMPDFFARKAFFMAEVIEKKSS